MAIESSGTKEREQDANVERCVLGGAVRPQVLALDELGKLLASGSAGSRPGWWCRSSPQPHSGEKPRSISSSPCRGVFACSSSEAQRKNTTATTAPQ